MEKTQTQTSRSIARNAAFAISTFVLPLILSFIGTPVLVKSLGLQNYGIYVLASVFVGFSIIFSFSRAITKYVAEFRIAGENEKISGIISAALYFNLLMGLLSILLIWLSADFLVTNILNIETDARSKTVYSLYIVSLIIFFTMPTQIFTAVLQGVHRFDSFSKILNFNNVVLLCGNIILALSGFGVLSLLFWNLTVTCITCLIFAKSARDMLPEFKLGFRLDAHSLKLLLTFSAGSIGYQILANFLQFFERGWVTRNSGADNLTYYVVPMMLAVYINAFISSLMLVVFPLTSQLKTNKEKLLRLYRTATKIVYFFVIFLGTTLIVESEFFLTLWLGAEFAQKATLILIIHTITFTLTAMSAVAWQMTEGLGYTGFNCFLFMINLSISLLFMIGLTEHYGNAGVAFGRLSGTLLTLFSIIYIEKRFLGGVQGVFRLKLLGILVVAALTSAVVENLIIGNFALSWATFAAANVCGGIFYCGIAWLLGFVGEEEKLLMGRVFSR